MDQEEGHEQPLESEDRYFVQPRMNFCIALAIGFEDKINVETLKNKVGERIFNLELPTPFYSLLVRDSHGRERWRRTTVDIDRHFIIVNSTSDKVVHTTEEGREDVVNEYMAYLSSSRPLSTDKPLWEIHILEAQRAAIFHGSHAIGDGTSLMALLTSLCRKVDDGARPSLPNNKVNGMKNRNKLSGCGANRWSNWLRYVYNSVFFLVGFLWRGILWPVRDATAVRGSGESVPTGGRRKMGTARFQMHDMEFVKRLVPGATINDVLFGVISCGLSRYLQQSVKKESRRISSTMMVNLRQYGDHEVLKNQCGLGVSWGNIIGLYMVPTVSDCDYPLQYVKKAKHMIDRRKNSIEANFSKKFRSCIMTLFGAKVASYLMHRILRTNTFLTSNLIGPEGKVAIASNPVKYIRITTTTQHHDVISIIMHLVSYAGVAEMQISVVEELIPDPKSLAKCFEDVLLEMKQCAERGDNTKIH